MSNLNAPESVAEKTLPVLTPENYYSVESNIAYVSVSQYKDFVGTTGKMGCEAAALARMRGELTEEKTIPLLVGSYVDAYFEGTLPTFVAQNPSVISTRGATVGQLKSEYKQADLMIQRAERDEVFMRYMEGDKQIIMTGEIEGVPVKIKIDSCDGKRLTDLKTIRSITETFYAKDLNQRLNFCEWWGYDLQGAVYREVYRQNTGDLLPFYICAISKDKTGTVCHPRIKVIEVPPIKMDEKLIEVKSQINKIQDLKNGLYDPIRCEICDYCADTEVLDGPISMDVLMGEI
ncbi:MAG: PD-(D/E)XK nuclease-like domain-containing protein [Lachnospiraceae bacterium]|nr:PD-(D/E)XK nuclease-like domain-containing protein [Lachnospiraceae bacterium]